MNKRLETITLTELKLGQVSANELNKLYENYGFLFEIKNKKIIKIKKDNYRNAG